MDWAFCFGGVPCALAGLQSAPLWEKGGGCVGSVLVVAALLGNKNAMLCAEGGYRHRKLKKKTSVVVHARASRSVAGGCSQWGSFPGGPH